MKGTSDDSVSGEVYRAFDFCSTEQYVENHNIQVLRCIKVKL